MASVIITTCFDIDSGLNEKTYISTWSDLSTYYDWSNQKSLMAMITEKHFFRIGVKRWIKSPY